MNAAQIIEAIKETTADKKGIIDALNDGEALAAIGVTDADQEAVEEAHAIADSMITWTITQPASGAVIGEYEGETERDALLAMAQDQGYESIEELDEVTGSDNLAELQFS